MTAKLASTKLPVPAIIPCDDRCMFAKGDDCDCECQGKNHKQGGKLTAAQREIVRTKAGRRVKPLTPGTPDFKLAARILRMRDKQGMTQKDIAVEMRMSAPTVRRLITRYLLTVAAAQQAPVYDSTGWLVG